MFGVSVTDRVQRVKNAIQNAVDDAFLGEASHVGPYQVKRNAIDPTQIDVYNKDGRVTSGNKQEIVVWLEHDLAKAQPTGVVGSNIAVDPNGYIRGHRIGGRSVS